MNLDRNKIIIIAGIAAALIAVVLYFIFGTGGGGDGNGGGFGFGGPSAKPLQVWGVFDEEAPFQEFLNKGGAVTAYQKFDAATYESELINALAAGQGPDIFMFHGSWLPKHLDKIIPLSASALPLEKFRGLFPRVVEQDFAPDGVIYALPLYLDTLALFYNKDIFEQEGIALPPKNWTEFQNAVRQTRKIEAATNKIIRAGAAIGGSNKSINRGSDILSNLMLQTGTKMTNDDFSGAIFAADESGVAGLKALNFYIQFSNPASPYYTWNESFLNSLDAFSQSSAAMMLNYAYQIPLLKERNPFLNFGVAPLPQSTQSAKDVNFANYWGLAVSGKSANPGAAWGAILSLTTNPAVNRQYAEAFIKPPALLELIQENISNPQFGVFSRQALNARSWPQIDNVKVEEIFSGMIENILSGRLSAEDALTSAQDRVTELMRRRRVE